MSDLTRVSKVPPYAQFQQLNLRRLKGFPADNKQVFEIYWSKSQVEARSHPNVIATQRSVLQRLFKAHTDAQMSLSTPVTYADRLRIRLPGDNKFALGPHIEYVHQYA